MQAEPRPQLAQMTRRVLQLSDPHVLASPDKVSGMLDTAEIFETMITRILADWEKLAPIDAVVITGDITDRGDAESYALFRQQVDRLPAPSFVIPGNHDLREPMRASFADTSYMPPTGKLNWVHDLPGIRLIGLDTLVEGKGGGEFDADTQDFLASALAGAAMRPVLLALHHPPFASGIRFMDAIGLAGIDSLDQVLRRAKSPVRIVCGHVHGSIIASVGGHVAIASPSLCSSFETDFRGDAPVGFTTQPGGYMIHVVEGSEFRSSAISLAQGNGPFDF